MGLQVIFEGNEFAVCNMGSSFDCSNYIIILPFYFLQFVIRILNQKAISSKHQKK